MTFFSELNWTDILLKRNHDIHSYSEQSESDDDQFIAAQKEVGGESLWFYLLQRKYFIISYFILIYVGRDWEKGRSKEKQE